MGEVTIVTGVGASLYAQTLKSENSKTMNFVDTGDPYVLKHRAVARSIYILASNDDKRGSTARHYNGQRGYGSGLLRSSQRAIS